MMVLLVVLSSVQLVRHVFVRVLAATQALHKPQALCGHGSVAPALCFSQQHLVCRLEPGSQRRCLLLQAVTGIDAP